MIDEPVYMAAIAGALGVSLEGIAQLVHQRSVRRPLYLGVLLMTAYAAALLLVLYPTLPGFLVWLVAVYRMLNAARVSYGRVHADHSFQVTRRTSWFLLAYQGASLGLLYLSEAYGLTDFEWLYAICLAAVAVAVVLLVSLRRNLKKSAVRHSDTHAPSHTLPSVSVCIPARNETESLTRCLQSVVASDYPKLEVLVLDDCSQQKTSEIIKGFARDGVRFIQGDKIRKGWLAKNQAYDALTEAASGELLLFCGVDVELDPHAIRTLVNSLEARQKDMISVLPRGRTRHGVSGLIQPMRYWWELALPRRLFNRPPSLSTAWLIRRTALKASGGFRAVSNMVVPESFFARELAKSDKYSFMRASDKLAISSDKDLRDQWETAVRLRYPQLHKRPEAVLLLAVAETCFLLVPLAIFIVGFFYALGLLWLIAGTAAVLLGIVHIMIIRTWRVPAVSSVAAVFPLAVLLEIWMLHYSMYRYEFSKVIWKERDVCIPVMHTIARLPEA